MLICLAIEMDDGLNLGFLLSRLVFLAFNVFDLGLLNCWCLLNILD